MQHTIKRAVNSAYDNFASPRNTLVTQLLIAALLGLIVLLGSQRIEGGGVAPITFDGVQ